MFDNNESETWNRSTVYATVSKTVILIEEPIHYTIVAVVVYLHEKSALLDRVTFWPNTNSYTSCMNREYFYKLNFCGFPYSRVRYKCGKRTDRQTDRRRAARNVLPEGRVNNIYDYSSSHNGNNLLTTFWQNSQWNRCNNTNGSTTPVIFIPLLLNYACFSIPYEPICTCFNYPTAKIAFCTHSTLSIIEV